MNMSGIAILCLILVAALPLSAAEVKLGKPIDVTAVTPIEEILANPEKFVGTVVRVDGNITDVCQEMGCWIEVQDQAAKNSIRVKVKDGEIIFPKDSKGKKVVAQGKVEKLVLTKEQYIATLKHEAEANKKQVDTSKITEGKTIYRIQGAGAVID